MEMLLSKHTDHHTYVLMKEISFKLAVKIISNVKNKIRTEIIKEYSYNSSSVEFSLFIPGHKICQGYVDRVLKRRVLNTIKRNVNRT